MLNNLSVTAKGVAAFAMMALIGVLSSYVAYTKSITAADAVTENGRLQSVIKDIGNVEADVLNQVVSVKNFLLTGDRRWVGEVEEMNGKITAGFDAIDGEIIMTTAFRPGVRLSLPGTKTRVSLPLEFCVRDNGPGVPSDLMPHLFDPFVTTKPSGTGLGLALVAKIIGDHGGIIECESQPRHTTFRVLMPMFAGADGSARVEMPELVGE